MTTEHMTTAAKLDDCRHELCADLAAGSHSPCRRDTSGTVPTDREEAIAAAEEVLHDAGWFARANLEWRDLRGILRDLADAGVLGAGRDEAAIEARALKDAADAWAADPDAVGDSDKDARNWLRDRADARLDGGA